MSSSLTSVSSWVGIATGPLEVDKIVGSSLEVLWDEVVFSRWVGLNDVSSLSSNVEVEDSLGGGNSRGSWKKVEDVRSVLEGSSELRSIGGKLESQSSSSVSLFGDGLGSVSVEDGGVVSVLSPVNESSIWSVSVLSHIGGRDVVSQSENAVAVAILNAGLVLGNGESPVVHGWVSRELVSELVVSSPWCLNTVWGGDLPCGLLNPGVSGREASWLVVGGSLDLSVLGDTSEPALNVLGLFLVVRAPALIVSQDGNVLPWGSNPVRVVIPLFWALVTSSSSVVVLSSNDGVVSVKVSNVRISSVSNPESLVSLTSLASGVKVSWFVHSELVFSSGGILGSGAIGIVGNGIGGGSISNQNGGISIGGGAHVLNDEVAVHLGVLSTTVLVGPLNGEERTFIIAHGWANAISSLGVVLRVEEPVGVVSVLIGLIESVIGTSWVVHVQISAGIGD